MAFRGQMLDNPVTGERIIFRETSEKTGGERLVFDLILTPGGRVPAPHVHPEQEECFTVTRGTMHFWRGFKRVTVQAGSTVVIPPGAAHQFANGSDEPAHVRVEVMPALRIEALLETSAALAREGRTSRSGMPKPLDLALFLRQFEREAGVPLLPPTFVRRATGPLAWLAKAQGRNRRYEHKATETQPGMNSRFALTSQHLLLLTGENGSPGSTPPAACRLDCSLCSAPFVSQREEQVRRG